MTKKKFCMWCETGSVNPYAENPMVNIHLKCFLEITSIVSDIETVKKYLRGEMPRILTNGDRQGYESVERFLVEMEDFDRKWNNSMKLIKKLSKPQEYGVNLAE